MTSGRAQPEPPPTCRHCDAPIAGARIARRSPWCSPRCRDAQPARRAADAERHRLRYATDTAHREARRTAGRTAARLAAGIPVDVVFEQGLDVLGLE